MMKYHNPHTIESVDLQHVANHLIIQSSVLADGGLYHGKTGLVLFFAHYARYAKTEVYDKFAEELLEEVYEDISQNLSYDFENGLSGIGWAIEYLLQNGFMSGDSDEVLEEIDKKIMEYAPNRISDKSFETGLGGLYYYVHTRINSTARKSKTLPFDADYLADIKAVADKVQNAKLSDKKLLQNIIDSEPQGDSFLEWNLGLKNGCAGYGLKTILS